MKITYHGHSCISIVLKDGQRLMIDPFLTGNDLADIRSEAVKTDWILITHGHNDHVGDMEEIAKNNDATIIGIAEIATFAEQKGLKAHGMNIGGAYEFPFGKVKMVFAQHSSSYQESEQIIYLGEPAGFILEMEGRTIYHAGDTALFSDLSLLADCNIDLAFLPIGDNFTMGPEDAAKAASMIKAAKVVPIHYDTFPVIKQDPQQFIDYLPVTVKGEVMKPGQTMEV